jgi:hypothetical protein
MRFKESHSQLHLSLLIIICIEKLELSCIEDNINDRVKSIETYLIL